MNYLNKLESIIRLDESKMKICKKCNSEQEELNKYCSECGDFFEAKNKDPNRHDFIRLTFSYSKTNSFTMGENFCNSWKSVEVKGDGSDKCITANFSIFDLDDVIRLHKLVSSLKSTKLYINGFLSTGSDLKKRCLRCFKKYCISSQKDTFCYESDDMSISRGYYNIFGCHQLEMDCSNSPYGNNWKKTGQFNNDGSWSFNKNKIKDHLKSKAQENSLCPIFDLDLAFYELEKIPDEVNPNKDEGWKYIETYEGYDDKTEIIAVGVVPVGKDRPKSSTFLLRTVVYDDSDI
ncbi:hypothetical protein GCM10009104_01140 [Marinobacterium maritimum]|uniref:Zinc ribbon domain-containing protein n=1 Tax=Marinobacterium maritimum TaxID=500162 RepID=A0ABN1I149_9GAMM